MAIKVIGGGPSAVAASAHVACARLRGTDPLATGVARRTLTEELGHPGTAVGWKSRINTSAKYPDKSVVIEDHQALPHACLKEDGVADTSEGDGIANLAFLGSETDTTITDRETADYRSDFVAEQADQLLGERRFAIVKGLNEVQGLTEGNES